MKHARPDYNRIQDPAGLIPEDEPVFLLRGQDKTAADVVEIWSAFQSDRILQDMARCHAKKMRAWPKKKTADITPEQAEPAEPVSDICKCGHDKSRHVNGQDCCLAGPSDDCIRFEPVEPASRLNTPEPPPIHNDKPATWDLVIADMRQRDADGRAKYGTPLQPFNGRKNLTDLYQELLDAVVYTRNEIEERAVAPAPACRCAELAAALAAVRGRAIAMDEADQQGVLDCEGGVILSLFDGVDDCETDVLARHDAAKDAEIERLRGALEKANSILFAYTDNEITAHPWWAVVRNGSFGRMVVLDGPFFSRERAEQLLEARRHEYGKKAYVFCYSGYRSEHYIELRETLKAALEVQG